MTANEKHGGGVRLSLIAFYEINVEIGHNSDMLILTRKLPQVDKVRTLMKLIGKPLLLTNSISHIRFEIDGLPNELVLIRSSTIGLLNY